MRAKACLVALAALLALSHGLVAARQGDAPPDRQPGPGAGLQGERDAGMVRRHGQAGPVFPIQERDLLEHIGETLIEARQSGRLRQLRQAARERAAGYVHAPGPVAGLQEATRASTRLFDPTVRLREDIVDANGNLLRAAGSRVNPLDSLSLDGRLVFFDARREAQVAYAVAVARQPGRTRLILTGGSPGDFAKLHGGPVYFDQQGAMSRRLGLSHVPAVVTQQGRRLRIDSVAPLPAAAKGGTPK